MHLRSAVQALEQVQFVEVSIPRLLYTYHVYLYKYPCISYIYDFYAHKTGDDAAASDDDDDDDHFISVRASRSRKIAGISLDFQFPGFVLPYNPSKAWLFVILTLVL